MLHTEDRKPIASRLSELKTLRDEIRLELHLAGMDLRDEWQRIERALPEPSKVAEDLKGVASEGLDRMLVELRRFQTKLRDGGGSPGQRSG
jgi:hypothetical protein